MKMRYQFKRLMSAMEELNSLKNLILMTKESKIVGAGI